MARPNAAVFRKNISARMIPFSMIAPGAQVRRSRRASTVRYGVQTAASKLYGFSTSHRRPPKSNGIPQKIERRRANHWLAPQPPLLRRLTSGLRTANDAPVWPAGARYAAEMRAVKSGVLERRKNFSPGQSSCTGLAVLCFACACSVIFRRNDTDFNYSTRAPGASRIGPSARQISQRTATPTDIISNRIDEERTGHRFMARRTDSAV